MPAEIRHLVFSETEVSTAIRNYCRKRGELIPDRVIFRLEDCSGQPSVVMCDATRNNARIDLRITGDQLLPSMILYCHNKKIPLPARGSKELCITKGRLTVVVMIPTQQMLTAQAS